MTTLPSSAVLSYLLGMDTLAPSFSQDSWLGLEATGPPKASADPPPSGFSESQFPYHMSPSPQSHQTVGETPERLS